MGGKKINILLEGKHFKNCSHLPQRLRVVSCHKIFCPDTEMWLDDGECCTFCFTCISRLVNCDCKCVDVTVILLAQMIQEKGQSCKMANRSQSYWPSKSPKDYFRCANYVHAGTIMPVCVWGGNSSKNIQKQAFCRLVNKDLESFLLFNT